LDAAIGHLEHRKRCRRSPNPPRGLRKMSSDWAERGFAATGAVVLPRGSHVPHQQAHQRGSGSLAGLFERAVAEGFGLLLTRLHSVWGRVVADIPYFCRELVAALADE